MSQNSQRSQRSQHSQHSQHSQSSVSSHLSHLSEEARILNLQRQTDALFGPDQLTQPRHRSYDDIYNPANEVYYSRAGPPSLVRLGASVVSLPEMVQNQPDLDLQTIHESDWLTPRAERQLQEYFPLPVTSSHYEPKSTSQSPRSLTPLANRRSPVIPPPPSSETQRAQSSPHRTNKCELCRRRFPNVATFRDHQLEHLRDEQDRQTYTCPVCDAEFLGRTTMVHSHIPLHYRFNPQTKQLDLI